MVGLLNALADPVRVRLMSLIAAADETCVCDLTAPSAVSPAGDLPSSPGAGRAGLLEAERRATWVHDKARREALDTLGGLFGGVLTLR